MSEQPSPSSHEFRKIYCIGCGTWKNVRIDCGFRFCPQCSRPRANTIRRKLDYLISRYPPPPGQSLKMITLSTRNCQDLGLGIKHLVKSFRKLRQRRFWKHYCSGGATIIEITGKKGDYHPHLHILCYCSYVPWAELLRRWAAVSGGLGCYISVVNKLRALNYVTKYITKCQASTADLHHISDEIKRYRLFQRFGLWHSFVLPKIKPPCICDKCGCEDWLSEFEVSRVSRAP